MKAKSVRGIIGAILITVLSGCGPQVNVGPLYDSAIQNFKAAKDLENNAIEVERTERLSEIATLMGGMEGTAVDQVETLVITEWDIPVAAEKATESDFKEASREATWRRILGVPTGDLPAGELARSRGALQVFLSRTFSYQNSATEPKTQAVTANNLLRQRGIEKLSGAYEPAAAEKKRLAAEYAAWYASFRKDILGELPYIRHVRETREALTASIGTSYRNRTARTDALYEQVIELSETAKAYSGALTNNAQVIAMANRLVALGSSALGSSMDTTKKSATATTKAAAVTVK